MGLKENELTHGILVDRFLERYNPVSCDRSYLLALKSSTGKRALNDDIHLSETNEADVNLLWSTLREYLSNDDLTKFHALLEFGRENTEIRPRPGR